MGGGSSASWIRHCATPANGQCFMAYAGSWQLAAALACSHADFMAGSTFAPLLQQPPSPSTPFAFAFIPSLRLVLYVACLSLQPTPKVDFSLSFPYSFLSITTFLLAFIGRRGDSSSISTLVFRASSICFHLHRSGSYHPASLSAYRSLATALWLPLSDL